MSIPSIRKIDIENNLFHQKLIYFAENGYNISVLIRSLYMRYITKILQSIDLNIKPIAFITNYRWVFLTTKKKRR